MPQILFLPLMGQSYLRRNLKLCQNIQRYPHLTAWRDGEIAQMDHKGYEEYNHVFSNLFLFFRWLPGLNSRLRPPPPSLHFWVRRDFLIVATFSSTTVGCQTFKQRQTAIDTVSCEKSEEWVRSGMLRDEAAGCGAIMTDVENPLPNSQTHFSTITDHLVMDYPAYYMEINQ